MKYSIQWYYLGQYIENIDSNNIDGTLLDYCNRLWKKWKPCEGIHAEVYDEGGNCVFILE